MKQPPVVPQDLTLPLISLFTGRGFDKVIQETFESGPQRIEDLWLRQPLIPNATLVNCDRPASSPLQHLHVDKTVRSRVMHPMLTAVLKGVVSFWGPSIGKSQACPPSLRAAGMLGMAAANTMEDRCTKAGSTHNNLGNVSH